MNDPKLTAEIHTYSQVVPIGGKSALATLDWELRRADRSVIREWRQSYNVVRVAGGWQILVSTFHVK